MDWQILRDQVWTFIGVIISLIAIVIPIIIYFLQKSKKQLSFEFLGNNSILSNKDKLEGNFKIFYKERILDNVSFLEVKFINNGNQSISSKDFEELLSVNFKNHVEIISAEIIKTEPENLNVDFDIENNSIKLKPLLLNAKDFFTIKFILSQQTSKKDLIVDGRIKDIKEISEIKESIIPVYLTFLGLIVTFYGLYRLESLSPKVEIPWTNEKIMAVALIIIGYSLVFSLMLTRRFSLLFKEINKSIYLRVKRRLDY